MSRSSAKPVPAAREFAGVPRETTERLWEWNEITVLGALRRIHAEIRTKGESPELVAGLAVGYANLGSLTASYFGPAHKAFFARALLYAERLVHESDGSDWALWHRGYVRALVGLHNAARLDFKAAQGVGQKDVQAAPLLGRHPGGVLRRPTSENDGTGEKPSGTEAGPLFEDAGRHVRGPVHRHDQRVHGAVARVPRLFPRRRRVVLDPHDRPDADGHRLGLFPLLQLASPAGFPTSTGSPRRLPNASPTPSRSMRGRPTKRPRTRSNSACSSWPTSRRRRPPAGIRSSRRSTSWAT